MESLCFHYAICVRVWLPSTHTHHITQSYMKKGLLVTLNQTTNHCAAVMWMSFGEQNERTFALIWESDVGYKKIEQSPLPFRFNISTSNIHRTNPFKLFLTTIVEMPQITKQNNVDDERVYIIIIIFFPFVISHSFHFHFVPIFCVLYYHYGS